MRLRTYTCICARACMHHSDGAVVAPLRTTRARVATLLHISLSLSPSFSLPPSHSLSDCARGEGGRIGEKAEERRSEGAKDERANERASECERKSGSSASVRKSRRCVSALETETETETERERE